VETCVVGSWGEV
jgi:hypothetical protein